MVSKSISKSANNSIYQLMKYHKDGMSFESRYSMTSRLKFTIKELHDLGYGIKHLKGVKQKHIDALVTHWKSKALSAGTIKNRMADLRFVCKSFGRASVVKSNDQYGIENRIYQPTSNKAIYDASFNDIKDSHLRLSLELQKAFGLRREECLKLMPHLADKGDHLWLKDTWTKGKIERQIPISTTEQREVLNKAKAFVAKSQSLIPSNKNYIQQRHVYNKETRALGFKNLHGLRHAYAQSRYKEITGMNAPINAGKLRNQMTKEERKLDQIARKVISTELGHSRSAITKVYVG